MNNFVRTTTDMLAYKQAVTLDNLVRTRIKSDAHTLIHTLRGLN